MGDSADEVLILQPVSVAMQGNSRSGSEGFSRGSVGYVQRGVNVVQRTQPSPTMTFPTYGNADNGCRCVTKQCLFPNTIDAATSFPPPLPSYAQTTSGPLVVFFFQVLFYVLTN